MIINHNIAALNTYRQLSNNNLISNKSLEKLSSGLRINRAGDDAAGLAISEKMRAQIRGLDQASRNAQDAISLIQTAEGGLNETHSILQRMRELADQAANDTNVKVDRDEIQKEINQLTSEINRIGNATEFNTMKLLNGDRAMEYSTITHEAKTHDAPITGAGSLNSAYGVTSGTSAPANTEIKVADSSDEAFKWSKLDTSAASKIEIEKTEDGAIKVVISGQDTDGNTISVSDGYAVADKDGNYAYDAHGVSFTISADDYGLMAAGNDGKITLDMQKIGAVNKTPDTASAVVDQTLTANYAIGVKFTGTGEMAKVVSGSGVENKLTLDTDLAGVIDWGDVDDGDTADSTITITKLDDSDKGFSVDIHYVKESDDSTYDITDNYATYDKASDTYTFNQHGVSFKITAEELEKMDSGDKIEINVAEVVKAGGVTDATGEIALANNWTTLKNEDGTGSLVNAIKGDIEIDGAVLNADAAKLEISFAELDAGDDTSRLTVTVKDADDNIILQDDISLMDLLDADGDNYIYNDHGIKFTIDQTADSDSKLIKEGEISFDLQRSDVVKGDANATGAYSTRNDWTVNKNAADNLSDAALTGNKIDVDQSQIDAAARSIEVKGADLQTDGSAKITVVIKDGAGGVLVKDEFTFGSAADAQSFTYNNHGVSFELTQTDAVEFAFSKVFDTETVVDAQASTEKNLVSDKSLGMQIGANTGQAMFVDISDMRSAALMVSSAKGEETVDVIDNMGDTVQAKYTAITNVTNGTNNVNVEYALDVSSHKLATAAISVINGAIETVSAERSKLGAFQNRLEHTINNLGTSSENLSAAESRIRDVDMAKEIMEFTKMNILSQAAQAMLAQANQQPQGVLQLLR